MSIPNVLADLPLNDLLNSLLAGKVQLSPWDTNTSVDAIYSYGHPSVDAELLDKHPNVRVISNYGVGVDHIDVEEATRRGIPVGNTPGVLNGATADMAFALLLMTARRLGEGTRYARGPDYLVDDPTILHGREVHHSTLGIVGMGRIGEEIAKRAHGFDMTVLYHNRNRKPDAETKLGVKAVSLKELLQQSDHVVLSTPLTKETRGLIGADELALMKPTATLINIARGPVVDTDALTDALTNRRIFAAGADVTDPEPLPRDHPLLKLDNFVLTPHLGSCTVETRQQMAELSVENLLAGLAGKLLPSQVDS